MDSDPDPKLNLSLIKNHKTLLYCTVQIRMRCTVLQVAKSIHVFTEAARFKGTVSRKSWRDEGMMH
jgi:hypothetical protein